jgi:hypothetical protein
MPDILLSISVSLTPSSCFNWTISFLSWANSCSNRWQLRHAVVFAWGWWWLFDVVASSPCVLSLVLESANVPSDGDHWWCLPIESLWLSVVTADDVWIAPKMYQEMLEYIYFPEHCDNNYLSFWWLVVAMLLLLLLHQCRMMMNCRVVYATWYDAIDEFVEWIDVDRIYMNMAVHRCESLNEFLVFAMW